MLVSAIVQNAGQTCSAASRLIVSEAILDALVDRLAEAMRGVILGRGVDDPLMGPLISARQRAKVTMFVQRAVDTEAAVLAGGSPAEVEDLEGGFVYPATLVDGVAPGSEIARHEVFGPVLSVLTFTSEDAAVEIANGTDYGLVSGVWTANGARALRAASALKCGQVFVNGYGAAGGIEIPFGGYAYSGYGRERGSRDWTPTSRPRTCASV